MRAQHLQFGRDPSCTYRSFHDLHFPPKGIRVFRLGKCLLEFFISFGDLDHILKKGCFPPHATQQSVCVYM